MEKVCPICGKPTSEMFGNARKDKLCRTHGIMANKGEIVQCADCGAWHPSNEVCICKKNHNAQTKTETKSKYTELPTEGFGQCVVCGAKTNGYAFCKACYNSMDYDKRLKILNGETTIEETNNTKSENSVKESQCIVCGKEANGNKQCKNCYEVTKSFIDTLDKNGNVRKFRDYYYNLKERIVIIRDIETAQEQCNKLIAIAITNQNENDDSSLMDRVYSNVESLLKAKQTPTTKSEEIKEKQKESDEKKARINTAKDGHNVDSDMEVRIDDALYNLNILHCYGKNIDEIIEKPKKCDWFIPIVGTDDLQGIFIEYWGMDTKDYLKDREEKEELYQKHRLPYISIEKDDPKKDTQTFESNLKKELTKKAIERFGFMPKWHKVD